MRYAIYGAGSLGTVLGAYITKSGEKIDLINRNRAHVEALNQHGARIIGTVDLTVPVAAITPEQMSGKYDVILLLTKQLHNKEVITMLKDYLTDEGVLVTLQNGLPEPGIAEIIRAHRTMGCTVDWGATLTSPGVATLTEAYAALAEVAREAGLEWINSDPDKVRAVQEAIAAEPKPVHVPREPRPVVLVDEGPLILVETRRDLASLQLPFEVEAQAARG